MKMSGIALAMASLMIGGAVAAPAAKKAVAKKATVKASAAKNAASGKKATNPGADAIQSSSSSAISASSSSMPGITAGSSTAAAPAVMKKKSVLDRVKAGILFEYYGSSVSEPFSGWQTDKKDGYAQGTYAAELDTRLTVGYAVTDNLTAAVNAYFASYGNNSDDEPGENFGFKPARSYLQLKVGKFIQKGNFKWNGDFRAYPGLGVEGEHLPLYLRTGQNVSYSLSPRLTLAAYNTLRFYKRSDVSYDADTKNKKTDFRVTLSPTIEFQMTDMAGISLSFNKEFSRAHKSSVVADTSYFRGPDYGQYFELGASLDLHKRVNLNPYVDMFTATPNIEAAQIGANLNISIL